jgi:benzoate-CoA ligase
MLKISGRWLSPQEVEHCLLQHPRVQEAVVVGAQDGSGLTFPRAFVVAHGPGRELEEELKAFVKQRLASYKVPRDVVFLEALPRTHLGKVDRGALRKQRR